MVKPTASDRGEIALGGLDLRPTGKLEKKREDGKEEEERGRKGRCLPERRRLPTVRDRWTRGVGKPVRLVARDASQGDAGGRGGS